MLENNTKDKKFKKLIMFVALSCLVIHAESYADQVQDIPKPAVTEQQTNKVILPAKENKSVDNSEEESESEENDESEDKTKEDEKDTENTNDSLQNKTIEPNNMVTKSIIAPKPAEKIIVCGIELGHTTVNELESKYKLIIICHSSEEYKVPTNWKVYSFDPNDLGTKELPLGTLSVANNEGGVIHSINIEIPVRMFDDVKQKYTNKQSELLKEEQKDGVTTIEYKLTDKIIKLKKSEKNFFVTYSDNEFKKAIDSMSSMQNMATSSEELKKTDNSDKPNGKKDTIKSESDGIDDLKPLGIVIGSTTEKELRSKYKIATETTEYGSSKMFDGLKGFRMLFLDVKNFDTKKAPQKVGIILDKKSVVADILLYYPKDDFKKISSRLSKKYSVIGKGKNYIRCRAKKYVIFSSMDSDETFLAYRSNEWNQIESKHLSRSRNPAPYDIELGKTTENEIRFKYQVVNEFMTNKNGIPQGSWKDPYFHLFRLSDNPQIFGAPNLKILLLKPSTFSSENLPVKRVSVAFDERKKVNVVSIVYPREIVDYLRKSLDCVVTKVVLW